jgi:hypothetical protein
MKKHLLIIIAFVAMLAASCSVTHPYQVTNNPIGTKKGKSSTTVIFGLGARTAIRYSSSGIRFNKNYGIIEAAKKGKITRIGSVDLQYTSYFFYGKYTLIVTGE